MKNRILVIIGGIWTVAQRIGQTDKAGVIEYELNGRRYVANQYTWVPIDDNYTDEQATQLAIENNIVVLDNSFRKVNKRPIRTTTRRNIFDQMENTCGCSVCRATRGEI